MSKFYLLYQKYFPLCNLFFIAVFGNLILNLNAQSVLKFQRYSTGNGLPANYTLDAFQDSKGFMWFGLRGAICRFDGYKFNTFPVESVRGRLKLQTSITNIDQDNNNRIWIGEIGQYGLLLFDYDKEVFVNCSEKLKLPPDIKKIDINSLMCDSKGNIWLGVGDFGAVLYNPNTDQVRHLVYNPDNAGSIPSGVPTCFLEDIDGEIWIGTTTFLYKYNRERNKGTVYKKLGDYGIMGLFKDSGNQIWITVSDHGLHKYNRETNDFERCFYNKDDIRHSILYCDKIAEDEQKRLWVGTSNGICITDRHKKSFVRYKCNDKDDESINSDIIKSIFLDRTGNMWVCTSEGVAKLKNNKFKSFKYSASTNSISQNKVQYFLENRENNIWISVPNGIDFFNRTTGKFTPGLDFINTTGTKITKPPIVFCKQPNKGVWVGTYGGGLCFFDELTRQVYRYESDKYNPSSLSSNMVFALYIDSKSNFWIGTWGGGLNLYYPRTGGFKRFIHRDADSTSLPANYIRNIYEDSKHNIWIGMVGGAAIVDDIEKGTFKNVLFHKIPDLGIDVLVYDFTDTENGESVWIATNIGLIRYRNKTGEIEIFNQDDGFPSSKIYGVLKDGDESLWLSTDKGLVQFYSNGESKVFDKSDGLQGNEFLPASRCRLHDGTMLFGGLNGFSMFHPDSISNNPFPPQLAFTGLEISNKPIGIGQRVNEQVVLNESITNQKHIVFNHRNNNFSIEFIALHYSLPHKIRYEYVLKGYETEWNTSDALIRKASYMNLPGGEYDLHVKAANCDGIWNKEGISMKITILDPWWKSLWFSLVSVIFFIASILSIIKLRTINLQKQKLKLEKVVLKRTIELRDMNLILEERKEELEQQMKQMAKMNSEVEQMAQQMHEADQLKLRFFTNISHEFRTPLTLIAAPLEKLLQKPSSFDWDKTNLSTYLKLMHKNSKRLLRLVNQIMDFRKIDQKQKTLNISHNNIADFIKEVISAFEGMAEAKQIKLRVRSEELGVKSEGQSSRNSNSSLITDHSSLLIQFWFDPDIMEKILFNLISNAIKYTPEGGEISIALDVAVETRHALSLPNNQLAIKISDTGIGIKPENIYRIFERFNRIETDESFHQQGTGIGLAYTKELVSIHGGSISVESKPGKGTVFTALFPFHPPDSTSKSISESQKSYDFEYINSMISPDMENHYFETGKQKHEPFQATDNKNAETVLIVEDNSYLRQFIRSELENKYIVYEAEDGEKGWEQAVTTEPDLIISDVMMPGMTGIEFCQKVKATENICHIPVILLTAKTSEDDIIRGFDTGADDYVQKPFSVPVLMARIESLLRTRKRLREKFTGKTFEINYQITTTHIDEKILKKAIRIVEENIGNPEFDNDMFIREMAMSRAGFYRKIKALTNQSASEFVRTIRLKTAAKLLLEEDKTIADIAIITGFKYRENFTKYFTAFFGKSPTDYLKENRERE